MNKPDVLSAALLAQVTYLRERPDMLSIFIDAGRIACRATGSMSFEYRYKLNLVVQDFAGSIDLIVVPLLAWIARHQPDLLERAPHEPFTFESEYLDSGAQDLSIDLELSELVRIGVVDGAWTIDHLSEPQIADAFPDVPSPASLLRVAALDVVGGEDVTTGG